MSKVFCQKVTVITNKHLWRCKNLRVYKQRYINCVRENFSNFLCGHFIYQRPCENRKALQNQFPRCARSGLRSVWALHKITELTFCLRHFTFIHKSYSPDKVYCWEYNIFWVPNMWFLMICSVAFGVIQSANDLIYKFKGADKTFKYAWSSSSI